MSRFDDLSPEAKGEIHDEFYSDTVTRSRQIEILTLLQEGANESMIGRRCPVCQNYPFLAPYDEPLIEGHVCSNDGQRELGITGYCEFCYDTITEEKDYE